MSILSPKEIASLGSLPVKAIAGHLVGAGTTEEAFRPNSAFSNFLHDVIRKAGPDDPELIAAAQQQMTGYIYIIDLRTNGGVQGAVPPEDIIGSFQVHLGKVVANSYSPNEGHQIFTTQGITQLPPSLREAFVRTLSR